MEDVNNGKHVPLYDVPQIVTIGSVTELTAAGGDKVVDAWGTDGKTAIDWNKHNSAAPEIISPAVLD